VVVLVAGFNDGRLGLWARVLARSFATSRADVGLAFPLVVVVLDEVEVVVWVVGLFVAFCLAVWTLEARLVTVFGTAFSFSEETPVTAVDGALEDGFSFFACAVSAGAVSWLSLTFRSLVTIAASSN
jgi:hypothetical protein